MGFMVTHLRIERWREALLWIWAVGKMGNLDSSDEIGTWGEAARAELKSLLNLETLSGTTLVVKQNRDTLKDMDSTFKKGNWETPKATTYSFSSMDGHVPPIQLYEREGPETCMFKVGQCLGEAFVNGTRDVPAEEMFKHLAFADWRCGDCREWSEVNRRKNGPMVLIRTGTIS
jgi:3-O-alpha-D-mannopyranosyl-alpha-D-mannopyranose xylosylphosphotransferase